MNKQAVAQSFIQSSWVTTGWNWFQTFLLRACEPVLWVTMMVSCYQVIPTAPQLPDALSTIAFLAQFIALDVGGLALLKNARQQGTEGMTFEKVVAYILISITLLSVVYIGIVHLLPKDPKTGQLSDELAKNVTFAIEVGLVVVRCAMTVIYFHAVHRLDHIGKTMQAKNDELESLVHGLQESEKSLRSTTECLQSTASGLEQERSTLRSMLGTKQSMIEEQQSTIDGLWATVRELERERDGLREESTGLQEKLSKREARSTKQSTVDQSTSSHIINLQGYGLRSAVHGNSHVDHEQQSTVYAESDQIDYEDRSTESSDAVYQSTGNERERIKMVLIQSMQTGEKLSYPQVAERAMCGLSTVKKWAPQLKAELMERTTGELQRIASLK